MHTKVIPIDGGRKTRPRGEKTFRALLKEALEAHVEAELQQFACDLSISRAMWRQHRSLVEALTMPEPFFFPDIEESGCFEDLKVTGLSPAQIRRNLRRKLRKDAIETAKAWAKRGRSPRRA